MSLSIFTVQFDNTSATYYAGQQVTGRVYVCLLKPKKLQGIEINSAGRASVHWREEKSVGSGENSRTEVKHYTSNQTYFQCNFFVLGGPHGEITLPSGKHFFPFQFTLPSSTPSSFEGKYGHVRYTMKGRILRPWRFHHECKVAFTVLDLVDLNLETNLQVPLQHTVAKTLGVCCWESPPITLVLSMPCRGFVSGQMCPAVVEVDNPSDSSVTVECELLQYARFTGHCGSSSQKKQRSRIVARHRLTEVAKYRSNMTSALGLRIPALPPSYLRNCECIKISYKLLVKSSYSVLQIEVPVVIGTIPLRQQIPPPLPHATRESEADRGSRPQATPSTAVARSLPFSSLAGPFSGYPDMLPPTYEESMAQKINIRSEDDNEYVMVPMEFVPRYPVFTFE